MNESGPQEFSRPRSIDGAEVKYRRTVADRQRAAQRLLMSAVDESYDGDLDIDWDGDVDPELDWLPERLSALYGTDIWRELSASERRELGRHELVNLLSFAVYAETTLTLLLFRDLAEHRELVDDVTRWALKAIEEETRNSSMFSRLINKAGLPIYRRPTAVQLLAKTVLLTPAGVFGRGSILMVQEAVHSLAGAMADDPSVQRHVRQLMRIHEASGTRHIEFSRLELLRAISAGNPAGTAVAGHLLALLVGFMYPMMLNDKVFQDCGIDASRAHRAARDGEQFQLRARAMTDSFVRFALDVGLFRHRGERWLLRRFRIWPPDVPDDIAGWAAN